MDEHTTPSGLNIDDGILTTTTSSNDTHYALQVSDYQLRVIYYTIGATGIAGNLLVLYVIARSPNMRGKITNMYILNQSTADFLGSLFMVLTSRFQEPGRKLHGLTDEVYCRLWITKWQMWAMFVVSTYSLTLITIERYLSIVHAVWHKTSFTVTKAVVSMVVVWICSLFYMGSYIIFPTKIQDGKCSLFVNWISSRAQSGTGIMNVFVLFVVPTTVLFFCYGRIIILLRNRIHPARNNQQQSTAPKMNRAMKNVIKTLLIVSFFFVLCSLFNHVYYFMFTLGYPADFTGVFYHFSVIFVSLNCCVNPFIYMHKYESFQANVRRLFPWLPRCLCCRARPLPESGSATGSSVVTATKGPGVAQGVQ